MREDQSMEETTTRNRNVASTAEDVDLTEETEYKNAEIEIKIDTVGEWDGVLAPSLVSPGYEWAPHEVGLYASSFLTDLSL